MSSSSLPQFYADFTFSSLQAYSHQFHGSSSCPDDVSTLSNNYYLDDCSYVSFNTSTNPDSTFSVPEYNSYNQKISVNNATQYFHNGDQDYYGFSPEIEPLFRPSTGQQSLGNSEGGIQTDPNTKIGRYSVEERKDRIMRYLKKKNQRNFNKTIKYVCRKTLADRRVRVRGRFARNNDTCEQQSTNHNNNSEKDVEEMFSGSDEYLIQMENDDGWLQEAMSNLMSFPCELDPLSDDIHHHANTWSF